MSTTGPKTKLKSLLKSFSDNNSTRTTGKTDTNKLIQLSQFIEYLQSLRSEDILSISRGLQEALLNTIIPHPQVSNLVYRDLVAQICILNFNANISKLRDFYISLQDKLQNNRSNSLRLTVLHVMGVLAANNPILSQFLNDTFGILLRTAKSSSLSVRIGIVDCVKNCIIGAQQGIKYAISDLMKLCEKISRDRDSRVRVSLSSIILLISHYYPDNLKEYISLIRKQCTVKHANVRHAFGDVLGKILARTIPADTETAKREKRRRQQQIDKKEQKQGGSNSKHKQGSKGAHKMDDSDDDMNASGIGTKSDDSSLAKSIIDFESGFFAALTLFDKLRNSTSGVSNKHSSWFGLTAGTQLLMSFLKECMLLSRFESTRLNYVIKQILKKLKTSKSSKSGQGKDGKFHRAKHMTKRIINQANPSSDNSSGDAEDGIVSCMSYVLRFGLFKYLDESSQSKAIQMLCEFITNKEKKRNRAQIYLCLNEIGYILHSLQCGLTHSHNDQINGIFLMCLRFTLYTSHAIRNRAAQCLALCAVCNPDQVFVWADGLIKEISATLSTIDSSDPTKMYLLHGRSIALSEIIKIIPQLKHGVPDNVAQKAFSVAVDLFNVDIQEDVSFNLEASSILTVCGWVLVDALIHLGTSWANTKIKTLLNIWRDVFSQTQFTPQTSSEAISLIYVKQAAYHSMLTFVKIFEKQIPIHPDLQSQIVKRLQHALDFEKYVNSMIHEHKKQNENILTPAVRHQLSRLRALMMNIFEFLPPGLYERHVTLLKLANANFSHRKAVTSNELEHLLDYSDDILCNITGAQSDNNTLVSRSCSELNIFIEYISNPTIDELGLDKSWMPQDLMHSILYQLGIIHDKNQINYHKSTRVTSLLADINDATQYDGSPKQIQTVSPHLSYTHYISSPLSSTASSSTQKQQKQQQQQQPIQVLQSMTIGGIMMNENDINLSLTDNNVTDDQKLEEKEKDKDRLIPKPAPKEVTKEILTKAKQKYNNKILAVLESASMQQSMRLIPRLTMSYFQKENCDANLRLFCKLFPYQNEQHKLKLVQHFVEVAKDAKQSEKSESLKIVLQNSAAVILGCCKCMLQNDIQFGKGKVRDSVLRIASDFLAFNNALVMRAGAQIFGILSRIEDDAFKTTIIQYLYKKKFGEEKSSIRAASALALGCIHQYSGSKNNLGFTVAALQLLERGGGDCNVSLWLLHSLQKILDVINNPSEVSKYKMQMQPVKKSSKSKSSDDDEAICRNILGFTLSILADEKDSVDTRVLNALLEILNILLTRICNQKDPKKDPNNNLLNTIIFMLKFIERLNIAELHSKLLQCSSKIAKCSPISIIGLDENKEDKNNKNDALDAQQYIIHQLQRCLFSGDLIEKVSAMDALQTFAKHSPSILVSKNVLHSLLYLLDVNATVPIIYNRALSALKVVTMLYGQKYPQSLLKYFRTISLRGMHIKPPEISQIISLLGQDLVIKKISDKKGKNGADNEWVIIPPSLPCLRYTSLLWIQCVTKSMIEYAVNKGGFYMDVSLARKQLALVNKNNATNSEGSLEGNTDFEYLILSISDLVQLVCRDSSCKYSIVRNKALQCLHLIILHFSKLPDPDAGYDGEFLLNQFMAQIHPAIRGIITTESDPSIRFLSAEMAVNYINCPLATEETIQKQFVSLFKIFDDNPGKNFRHLCGVYEPHVKTIIILQHLKAICMLYTMIYFDKSALKLHKKLLKTLFSEKLLLLKTLAEKALMDYVVVTSSTRKTIRDYRGNFFIGHSYRRVRQSYIQSFAKLLMTLARLISSSIFKKTVSVELQLINKRTSITLFATSLYCLQDCLIHFDDNKDKDLPLVQNACINLLSTLTSLQYIENNIVDYDMLFDLLTMIHGGIKYQINKNTALFMWDNDLSQLLLNIANTILRNDLSHSHETDNNNMSLLHVIINCWIDPINILITYISTAYDESPFNGVNGSSNGVQGKHQSNDNKNTKNGNGKIEIELRDSVLSSLNELIELICAYNTEKSNEQEIDCKNWALQLSDWCNVVTAISMLLSTAYKLSYGNSTSLVQGSVDKSLLFNANNKQMCVSLLSNLSNFEIYTKPDPNNPNFNMNCLTARGCISENINYLSHSISNGINANPKQYYTTVVVMIYKLAHSSMNVEINEDQRDDEHEKLNDRQLIESVENLRQFILVNIHQKIYQKFVINALNVCWKKLLKQIESDHKSDILNTHLQLKYSSLNIQIETMIVILPHIIMILSKTKGENVNIDFVRCLLCVLQIFDNIESVCQRFQNAKTCQQIYSVIIPLFVKYIISDNSDIDESLKDIITKYIHENLAENENLLGAVKSLPRTIVAYIQQLLTEYGKTHKTKAKKPKKHKKGSKNPQIKKEAKSTKITVTDENGDIQDRKKTKTERKKKKRKKKKKKKKATPLPEEEENNIDFGAF